ncbi:MAG: hypothetical protein P1V36_15200, partial [Planctomycetota bacterium]|nr:hypothetical protein [Planctomycetota bacterium]
MHPEARADLIECLGVLEHHAILAACDEKRRWLRMIGRLADVCADAPPAPTRLWTSAPAAPPMGVAAALASAIVRGMPGHVGMAVETPAETALVEILRFAERAPELELGVEVLVELEHEPVRSEAGTGRSFALLDARAIARRFPASAASWDRPFATVSVLRAAHGHAASKSGTLTLNWRAASVALGEDFEPPGWPELEALRSLASGLGQAQVDMGTASQEYHRWAAHLAQAQERKAQRAGSFEEESPFALWAGGGFLLGCAVAFFMQKKGAVGVGLFIWVLAIVIGGIKSLLLGIKKLHGKATANTTFNRDVASKPLRNAGWLAARHTEILNGAREALTEYREGGGVAFEDLPARWPGIEPPLRLDTLNRKDADPVSHAAKTSRGGMPGTVRRAEENGGSGMRRCAMCTALRDSNSHWCGSCFDQTPSGSLETASRTDERRGYHTRPRALKTSGAAPTAD